MGVRLRRAEVCQIEGDVRANRHCARDLHLVVVGACDTTGSRGVVGIVDLDHERRAIVKRQIPATQDAGAVTGGKAISRTDCHWADNAAVGALECVGVGLPIQRAGKGRIDVEHVCPRTAPQCPTARGADVKRVGQAAPLKCLKAYGIDRCSRAAVVRSRRPDVPVAGGIESLQHVVAARVPDDRVDLCHGEIDGVLFDGCGMCLEIDGDITRHR